MNNKKQIILLIIILILAISIGIGLFSFLRYAKNINKKYHLENRTVKLNSSLDDIKKEYSKFKDCKLNLDKVDTSKIGKYEYTIKCEKTSSKAYIYVK